MLASIRRDSTFNLRDSVIAVYHNTLHCGQIIFDYFASREQQDIAFGFQHMQLVEAQLKQGQ